MKIVKHKNNKMIPNHNLIQQDLVTQNNNNFIQIKIVEEKIYKNYLVKMINRIIQIEHVYPNII